MNNTTMVMSSPCTGTTAFFRGTPLKIGMGLVGGHGEIS